MNENSIYADIAKRTGGDIYIGVVGTLQYSYKKRPRGPGLILPSRF